MQFSFTYPAKLKAAMVFFIVFANDRLDKIAKFQFVTGDLTQFILFNNGQN